MNTLYLCSIFTLDSSSEEEELEEIRSIYNNY